MLCGWMRVLTSPPSPVDERADDFDFTEQDELLVFAMFVCEGVDLEGHVHAQACGCERSFSGLDSAKGATVGIVSDLPEAEVRQRLKHSHLAASWSEVDEDTEAELWRVLEEIANSLAGAPLGAPVRVKNTPSSNRLIL